MNERIREIWENNDSISVVWPETGSPVSVSAKTLGKFAELIIQECVSVINTEAAEHEGAWKMGTEFAAYQIKQHFGVEVTELDEPETPFWRPVMTNTVADLRSVVTNAMNRGEHNIAIALIELIKKNS